jgi:hypothetical protein
MLRILAAVAAAALAASSHGQNCELRWYPTEPLHGLDGQPPLVGGMSVAQMPGEPPRLYAGGHFQDSSGVVVRGAAFWNGQSWSPIDNPFDEYDIFVAAAFDPDQAGPQPAQLVMGGSFFSYDELSNTNLDAIAILDGQHWRNIGPMSNREILPYCATLTTFDFDGPGPGQPELVVGGEFFYVDGLPSRGRAAWNGSTWRSLSGSNYRAFTDGMITAHFPAPESPLTLVSVGFFKQSVTSETAYAQYWGGTSWLPSPAALGDTAYCLCEYDPDGAGPGLPSVYAGGRIHMSPTGVTGSVVRWTGETWVALPELTGGATYALHAFDPDGAGPSLPVLVAGGVFGVRVWDGSTWSAFGSGVNGTVISIADWDSDGEGPEPPQLFISGSFTMGRGLASVAYARAGCRGTCYPNCDGSAAPPILNALDFLCFLARFRAGDPYANCDGSTAAPTLNILDFNCFLNRFSAGCP